nr:putative transposase [Ipomoea batatas]
MAPMYILARDIDNRNTTAAMRLRLIRTYDIVQSRYSDKVRSRECVFHDEEVTVLVLLKLPSLTVPTKIPKEIESLVGRGMVFKINVQRDRLEKRNLPFPVMQIKEDIAVLNQYCPGLVKDTKQKRTTSVEPLDDDLDSDAGFFSDEEAKSPLPNALTQMAKGGGNESEAVKRRLLDEFSSTQCPKKKTHTVIIKLEKDSELGGDQNSKN